MLLRIILKNILSYREPTQFDMFPNPKRKQLPHHVIGESINTLKMAAIYGGNGAGKTNLIYAIDFIKSFVLDEFFLSNLDISKYIHSLSEEGEENSMSILVEFSVNDKFYIYEVEISREGQIEKEILKLSGLGKKKSRIIFTRKGTKITFQKTPNDSLRKAIEVLLDSNPTSSTLSLNKRFPILDSDDVKKVLGWFENHLQIVPLNADIKNIISLMHKNGDLLDFTKNTLKAIDLGIDGIRTQEETIDEYYRSHPQIQKEWDKDALQGQASDKYGLTTFRYSKPYFDLVMENGIKKIRELILSQQGKDGRIYDMSIDCQSDGTIRLLMLMPVFFGLLNQDVTFFVDEINYPIHPILIKALLRSFSSNAKTKGQLIFTTHEVELMEPDILRTDEVWIAEKKEGSTFLYSVNEFKLHKNLSMKSGYLDGRFGGVPYIDRLIDQLV